MVGRRQRLGVEELGQLVVLLGEAGAPVELVLQRSASRPSGSKNSFVRLVPCAALIALARNSVLGFVTLMPKMHSPSESLAATRAWWARLWLDEVLRVHLARLETRQVAGGMVRALRGGHHA